MPDPLWRFKSPERFAHLCRRSYHKRRDRILAHQKAKCDETQRWLEVLKEDRPCQDCETFYPHFIMEWDHTRGVRKYSISEMRNHSPESIAREIDKCDLVCANCHRRRTYERKQQGRPGFGRPRKDFTE